MRSRGRVKEWSDWSWRKKENVKDSHWMTTRTHLAPADFEFGSDREQE